MVRNRLLISVFFGTFFYVLVSFFVGVDGIWAYNQLKVQKMRISSHTAELNEINDELNLDLKSLKYDMDVIASHARRLGYVKPGEKLVKVTGLPSMESDIYDYGTALKHKGVRYVPESFCKAFGLIAGSLFYLVLFIFDVNRGRVNFRSQKKKYTEMKVVSGYEMF